MKNITSLDYSKLVFAICIVFAHTDFLGGKDTYLGYLFCQGLFRITVPFFFMVSGYFFYNTLAKNYEAKWLKTNIKIYLVWFILYIPVMIRLYNSLRNGEPLAIGTEYLTLNLLFGFGHLWYFPALIIAGLLAMVSARLPVKVLMVLSIGLCLVGTVLQYRANYSPHISTDVWSLANPLFFRNGLFMGYPYFIAGMLINKCSVKYSNNVLLLTAVLALIVEATINNAMGKATFDLLFSAPFVTVLLFNKLLSIPSSNRDTFTIREHSKNIYLIQVYAILVGFHLASGWLMISVVSLILCFAYSYFRILSSKASFSTLWGRVFSR